MVRWSSGPWSLTQNPKTTKKTTVILGLAAPKKTKEQPKVAPPPYHKNSIIT